jgi:hypothetical protein
MNRFTNWLRWLFRRGTRSSLVLSMRPGDSIVSMLVYRQYLCISTAFGELYMLDGDRLVEFSEATFTRESPSSVPRTAPEKHDG